MRKQEAAFKLIDFLATVCALLAIVAHFVLFSVDVLGLVGDEGGAVLSPEFLVFLAFFVGSGGKVSFTQVHVRLNVSLIISRTIY